MKGDRILDKLNNPGICGQWQNFVSADPKIPLPSVSVILEKIANLFENLLHDSVLTEIVVTSFELKKVSL